MFWKPILVTFLAAGVWAQYDYVPSNKWTTYENQNDFEVVADTFKNFGDCLKELYDPSALYRHIEAAKPVGALSAVFKKYCDNSIPLKTCIHERTANAITNPLEKLSGEINSVNNVVSYVLDFLCYNHGERLSAFLEDDGRRCFLGHANEMLSCIDQVKQYVPNFDAALRLDQSEKCARYEQVTSCITATLQGCTTPTTSRLAETLFSSIYNGSPCKSYPF